MIRFAYGCLPSVMSLYFANYLVRRSELPPTCIVLSSGGLRFKGRRYSNLRVLPLLLRQFGPKFTFYQVLLGLGVLAARTSNQAGLMSFKQLAREFDIQLVTSVDFSSTETLCALEPFELDLFVTCMCDQVVREPLLSTPRAGCLNLHFSLLPDFRGVDSIFQSMLSDVPEIGATLHRSVSRLDAGDVFEKLSFKRAPEESHFLLAAKAAAGAAKLLQNHVQALERGELPSSTTLDVDKARFPYRSWPQHEELRRFDAQGLAYCRLADLQRVLRFEDVLDDTQLLRM